MLGLLRLINETVQLSEGTDSQLDVRAAPEIASQTVTIEGTSVTTLSFDMPATRPDNDLYIVLIGKDDDPTFSLTGWTQIQSGNGSSSDFIRFKAFYRIGSSEPASYSTTIDSETYIAVVFRITGADTSSPIDISGVLDHGQTLTPSAPSVTTTVNNTLTIHAVAGSDALDDTITPRQHRYQHPLPQSGLFLHWTFEDALSGAVSMAASQGIQATAGATGAKTFDFDGNSVGEEHVGITIAVTPAPIPLLSIIDETENISEAVMTLLQLIRAADEDVNLSEAVNTALAAVRLADDNIQLSELVLAVVAWRRIADDTETISEAINTLKAMTSITGDDEHISEIIVTSLALGLTSIVDETENISEQINTLLTVIGNEFVQVVDETVNITEQVTSLLGILSEINETENISETVVRLLAMSRLLDESIQLTEQVQTLKAMTGTVDETEQITEQVLRTMEMVRFISEDVNIPEAVVTQLTFVANLITRAIDETIQISEQITLVTALGTPLANITLASKINNALSLKSQIASGLRLKSKMGE
jgi:hypothetical protein